MHLRSETSASLGVELTEQDMLGSPVAALYLSEHAPACWLALATELEGTRTVARSLTAAKYDLRSQL